MAESTGRKAIDLFVFLAAGAKSVEFTYTGGEPLTAFPTLAVLTEHAVKRASEAGMEANFVVKTNGTILNSNIVEFLRSYQVKVVVSADGESSVHDSHRKTVVGHNTHSDVSANLCELLENDISCVASLTVHPGTCAKLAHGVEFLHSLGCNRVDVGPAYGTVEWSGDQIQDFTSSLLSAAAYVENVNRSGGDLNVGPFYRETEHTGGVLADSWGCHAASSHLAVMPDGQISGCSALAMLVDRFPELSLGDVFNGIQQDAVDRMVSLAQAPMEDRRGCSNCESRINCTGGCLAINYATTGSPLSPPRLYCDSISVIPAAWQKAWQNDFSKPAS